MRTDNGREYITNSLKEFFAENGTLHHYTAPYTPQQNGRAERLGRTLTEKT